MPRRRALTPAQLDDLFALPIAELDLIRHGTLDRMDLAAVDRRRGGANQLGYALQLCAFRYPGRLLRPGDSIPEPALRFVAEQLRVGPEGMLAYAARPQTRREQLDGLREAFGFRMFAPGHGRELLAWLLPVVLATTRAPAIAATLMDELRRRRIVAPGSSVVERLVAAGLVLAERHVAVQLTRTLTSRQIEDLDALLAPKESTAMSVLAWSRQPPAAPGHRALARIVDQITCLRAIALVPACADGVHAERLRKLAREGSRLTAQHLRALSPLRRHATLVATVLDTVARLTDDGVALFDRAVGRMFRRAEVREEYAVLRDARAINDKVRLFAKLGSALIEANGEGTDLGAAVATSIGWERLASSVAEVARLTRPDKADLAALALRAWPVLHRLGPVFLSTFRLRAVPAATTTLRAVEMLRDMYASSTRKRPSHLPVSFLRPVWRDAVLRAGDTEHRIWEAATLLALRDRLRAGDIWVEGSRQWRAVEDQLIAPALFAAMREAGPLPVAQALAIIVNAQQRHPLAAAFGAADVSSSDGQHFLTAGRGEAVGAMNARYSRETATALFYTHHSARHAPYYIDAISPSGEAGHVIDGVLYHEADLSIATHHTDGGGVSEHVFALAHLLGFRFAPRIPNLAERRLYAFGAAGTWPSLAPFIAGRPDEKLVFAHWDDVLRLTASVRTGVVSASLMLKRLGAYPRQNGLALALREIGRIERTLFTLDWLEQPPLRRQATAELNKGESCNALSRAVCFHRLGRMRDRTAEAQQHRASGLALVTAAMALWNTVYLDRALDALRRRGEIVPDALLAHLAPLGWQHINLTGDYLWGADSNVGADGFRPLRTFATEALAVAA